MGVGRFRGCKERGGKEIEARRSMEYLFVTVDVFYIRHCDGS